MTSQDSAKGLAFLIDLKVNVFPSLTMAFIFHKMAWLCLSILATGGAHYPVRMFSPLSYYLLIIALFSIDNAFRNFHVIFSPLVPLLTCTAMGEDLGINPRKSRIMNLADSWRSFQGIL